MRFEPIIPAAIEWQGDTPYSAAYGDIYFSREGGLAETAYVFLEGNGLPGRWRDKPHFTICETGFGTGLNFLCTAKAWEENRRPDGWLYYISIEKHPIAKTDLARIHAQLPQALHPLAQEMCAGLPPAIPGFYWQIFPERRIALLLIQADIEVALEEMEAKIDAWFLDGFAPGRNPAMWGDALYSAMRRLSAPAATCATYSAASAVREGLSSARFEWQKRKGFGHKKHMLCGKLPDIAAPQRVATDNRAIVIGGGLAGCFAAAALARHGREVTLIERHEALAQEASGNPAAILKPYLAKQWSGQTLLYMQAFHHARETAERLGAFHSTGALQLETQKNNVDWQQQIISQLGLPEELTSMVTAQQASEIAGIGLKCGAIHLPTGGWIHPQSFCHAALRQAGVEPLLQTEALTLERSGNLWRVNNQLEAPVVIVANAKDALAFSPLAHLKLHHVRGQITGFRKSMPLKTILSYDGYALPQSDNITLGATFHPRDTERLSREEDNNKNICAFNQISAEPWPLTKISERVAWRTTTPSKLPIAGEMAEGLYVSLGLGSRGAMLAPYLAEQLAAEITGTPQPLQKSVKKLLSNY